MRSSLLRGRLAENQRVGIVLEEVGERIAARALELPLVDRVRIAVRKPNVALPGPLAYAEVALERERA